jgi:RNA polymerase sigma-70 factor (ECF subfamily)
MSTNAGPDPGQLLWQARAGSGPALGQLLERYGNFLAPLARQQIDRRLRGKADPEDLVQEVFLQASRDFVHFRGTSEAELTAWLRQILWSRLDKLVRHYCGTQRRDLRLERQLADEPDQGLASRHSTPSSQAIRREMAGLVADAVSRLPEDYREVLVLHYLEGMSLPEVARRLGRTVDSVRNLWLRALGQLRRVTGKTP